MEIITSKDNKWVKNFVKLSTQKSYRDQSSLFTIEGVKLVVEAFNNNIKFEMVFVTASCLLKKPQELEKLFQSVSFVVIDDELQKKMTSQVSPQGIFAICHSNLPSFNIKGISGKYVMLVDLQDAGNVGTIIRTAEAIGIDGIILTKNTCDLLSSKVLRASMGSIFRMKTLIVEDAYKTVLMLNDMHIKTYASVVDNNAKSVTEMLFDDDCVLLIGNEGNGLSLEVINNCSNSVTIKMHGNVESLNAGIAACILMWEITKN